MLVAVVGPSGAGKDSLLREARRAYAEDPSYVFMQREIDRKPSDNEQNIEIDRVTWEQRVSEGAYALHWEANGHVYGVSRRLEQDLAAGLIVVVNASREHLPQARAKYSPLRIIHVRAHADVLQSRRRARGRETPDEARVRAQRDAAFSVEDAEEVWNNDRLEDAVAAFVQKLSRKALGVSTGPADCGGCGGSTEFAA